MPGISLVELHPLIVHFPIALLLTSVALDFLSLWLRRARLVDAASWCLALGVVGALAAGISGEISSHVAVATPAARALVEIHQKVAILTGVVFATLLVLRVAWLSPRIFGAWQGTIPAIAGVQRQARMMLPVLYLPKTPRSLIALYLGLSVVGAILLAITGYLGGVLVYHDGVGTPAGLLPLIALTH